MHAPALIIAPDSFKGSLSALEAATALHDGLCAARPELDPGLAPMADGGEGTLECVASAQPGVWYDTPITGIHNQAMTGRWYVTAEGTAVIESAQMLGLPLIEATADAPPLAERSSAALGTVMRAAVDAGAERLAVGLGGSACNDAGLGLLTALGGRALDRRGRRLEPSMDGLLRLESLHLDGLDPRLADTDIRIFCDVDNPLLGETGASRVYGPQKGLTEREIEAVEAAFARLAALCRAVDAARQPGSGAAGGLGFALAACGGRLESGAEALMAITELRPRLAAADVVITGEGRSDRQTLSGKLPLAIARAAAPTPCVLVSGAIAADAETELAEYFATRYTLTERAGSVDAALAEPARWLRAIGATIAADLERLARF